MIHLQINLKNYNTFRSSQDFDFGSTPRTLSIIPLILTPADFRLNKQISIKYIHPLPTHGQIRKVPFQL